MLVGAFNQEKALVGAFSLIVKTDCETDGALHSTSGYWLCLLNVVLLGSVHSSQSGDISHWVLARLAALLPEYPRKLLNFPNGLNRHPSYVITSLEH